MKRMLAIFINGTHIGLLREERAHEYAPTLLTKVGDSAMLYTVDSYDHMAEECVTVYYRNSLGVQESDGDADLHFYSPTMWDEPEVPPTINHKLRDKQYAKVRTSRTYAESDHHRYHMGSEGYMSYIKRQERRASRRMGKALIEEQIAA